MRGIIFAAGMATRLGDLTKDLPKCCLPINESETILERNLKLMSQYGFTEIIIVTGHAADEIEKEIEKTTEKTSNIGSIELIFNDHYKDRNNIYTAYLIRDLIDENTLIFNSDIVYDERILAISVNAMKANKDSFMIVDNSETLVDEDMKVLLNEEKNIVRIHKQLDNEKSFGEYIGILRLSNNDASKFKASLENMINSGIYDKYYEDALDRITSDLKLKAVSTEAFGWTEIDTKEDYAKAKDLECVKLQYQKN